MCALGLGMGLTSIALSLRFRVPVLTAWSTPGAAMLITSAAGVSMPEAIGAFLVSAALITSPASAAVRADDQPHPDLDCLRNARRRPAAFRSRRLHRHAKPVHARFPMFCAYLLGRRLLPRYAIVVTLLLGVGIAATQGLLHVDGLHLELAMPVFTARNCRGRR
jgi:benzoate membrane transport protein